MRKQPLVLATNDWGCASIHGSSSETGPDRFITSSVKRIDHSLTIWDEGFVVHHPQFDGLVFALPEDEPFSWQAMDRLRDQFDSFMLMVGLLKVYTGPGTVQMVEVQS
jgi:hypothetical protein